MLVFGTQSQAQVTYQSQRSTADTTARMSAGGPVGAPATAKENASSQKLLLDVLIATNDNCVLLINDAEKKVVSKDAFLYLKLPPGIYRFSAKSQTTGDVYIDKFSVAEGALNEVFVDMLYAIDAENEKKLTVGSESAQSANGLVANNQTVSLQNEADVRANNTQELAATRSILANMVPVNGGSFLMGNNRSASADETEHRVMVNPFFFSKYEVTQDQWVRLMGDNPSLNKGCPTCPVENVSWEEAMVFIRKLNNVSNKKFRLPTEAEWEYVARLGGKEEVDKAGGAAQYVQQAAWNFTNAGNKTHPVGQKQPNAAGIYDMFGNVSEWCADWYGAFFYKEDFTEKNPEGPPLGKEKVIRGGNYKDSVGDRFRPSFRNKLNPKVKVSEAGFRLVLEK